MKAASIVPNRVHRRLIVRDYGMPIYKASSRSALLAAFERCIEGHESLHRAGLLHRDVSINNLMINEDDDNPSWPAFVIDLDLAIKESREAASGAKGKTGTRAFMAIGALLGEQHSFMHDLESFFWVLFWICIHYDGPGEDRVVQEFDKWNYLCLSRALERVPSRIVILLYHQPAKVAKVPEGLAEFELLLRKLSVAKVEKPLSPLRRSSDPAHQVV
ncbi:hypothetical protein CEP52_017844 [Fusarium oligoseptatum]|uniref:EKC/KEOPS complex subunit BUD32 n=1 Tax=Fusarium oligoseptatum TaxID=2604345 RepID=A0A428RDE3_9HYPO|nr:hypothetical protein CEP52_017844 [Fusarium oligoseptatum]